jgi:hypothetical protein
MLFSVGDVETLLGGEVVVVVVVVVVAVEGGCWLVPVAHPLIATPMATSAVTPMVIDPTLRREVFMRVLLFCWCELTLVPVAMTREVRWARAER